MDSDLARDMRAQCYWNKGLIRSGIGFDDYATYLETIPEPPESSWSVILVDPRVDFERICDQGIAGFSASSLAECLDEESGQPDHDPYWILVRFIRQPSGWLIREKITALPKTERGCTFMEGLAIRLQEPAEVGNNLLILPGTRFYGPPDDHYFRGVLYPNGQFAPICTDVRIEATIAVADRRIYR